MIFELRKVIIKYDYRHQVIILTKRLFTNAHFVQTNPRKIDANYRAVSAHLCKFYTKQKRENLSILRTSCPSYEYLRSVQMCPSNTKAIS